MSRLKVNWPDVETAFERNSPGLQSCIERVTGEVIVLIEGAPEDADKRDMIARDPEGYVRIEPASSREQYRWMERFVASVEDKELADRLLIAIDGKGAFRRFKDVLLSFPAERERWFNYRADLLHHHINRWFEAKELESEPPAPWGDVAPPPEPEQPLPRPASPGEGPADVLRKQVKSLVDVLPAGELHSARVFLEYLRDRGSAELNPARNKIDVRRPFRRRESGDSALDAGDPGDAIDAIDHRDSLDAADAIAPRDPGAAVEPEGGSTSSASAANDAHLADTESALPVS